jgi:hypothetical protein
MRLAPYLTAATLCLAAPAQAFMVAPCGPEFTPLTITEPWEEMSRTFANGAIRLFEMFIDPNVASGAALGILHPVPGSEGGPYRTCTAIYAGADYRYFGQAHVREATAVYDASRGLIVTMPVSFTDGNRVMLRFAVNQATGVVSLL